MNGPESTNSENLDPELPAAHLPRPTMWPMLMALGITLVLAGVALSSYFAVVGLIVFAISLYGWIQELLHG